MCKTLIAGGTMLLVLAAFLWSADGKPALFGGKAKHPQTSTDVREFALTAQSWRFDPEVVTVRQGDHVRLSVTSTDVTHGFALPAFEVKADLEPGQTAILEFTADQKGTFPFYCSVFCGEGHDGMTGKLIVE